MPTDKYTEYLSNTVTEVVIMDILSIVIAAIFIAFLVSSIREKDKENICIHSIILSMICFVIIASTIYIIVPYTTDIHNKSYIKYEGEYYVESIQDTGVIGALSHVQMGDGEIIKYDFIPNPNYWEEGKYSGYIVYSKRSKVILEWGGEKILP